MAPAYRYKAAMIRAIDGDTAICRVDLGFRVTTEIRVRLHGVNTPERGHDGWAEAQMYLNTFVAKPLILMSYKDKTSFERWVCDIYAESDEGWSNLSQLIIAKNLGVPFMV